MRPGQREVDRHWTESYHVARVWFGFSPAVARDGLRDERRYRRERRRVPKRLRRLRTQRRMQDMRREYAAMLRGTP